MPLELKQTDSPTTAEIRRLLSRIEQPFTRDRVFRDLRSGGSTLSKAAVSGWINRAIKKGELVAAATAGEYYLKQSIPKERTPVVEVPRPVSKKSKLAKISEIMAAVARGEVDGFEVTSGAGGLC